MLVIIARILPLRRYAKGEKMLTKKQLKLIEDLRFLQCQFSDDLEKFFINLESGQAEKANYLLEDLHDYLYQASDQVKQLTTLNGLDLE